MNRFQFTLFSVVLVIAALFVFQGTVLSSPDQAVSLATEQHYLTAPYNVAGIYVQQGWISHFDTYPTCSLYGSPDPTRKVCLHKAIDFILGSPQASPSTWKTFEVVAATPGKVSCGTDATLGKYIKMRYRYNDKNYTLVYAHLASQANCGRFIQRGNRLGMAGKTGKGDGPGLHLHFELLENGLPIDPYGLLQKWTAYPPNKAINWNKYTYFWKVENGEIVIVTPTPTPTTTITATPTITATVTITPTVTATPNPLFTPTPTRTVTPTLTPKCGPYALTRSNTIQYVSSKPRIWYYIANNDTNSTFVDTVEFDWSAYAAVNSTQYVGNWSYNGVLIPDVPATTRVEPYVWSKSPGVSTYNTDLLNNGSAYSFSFRFGVVDATTSGLSSSDFGVTVTLGNGCLISVGASNPLLTRTPTPTGTITLTPDKAWTVTATPTFTQLPAHTLTPTVTPRCIDC